jgi:hypothetical protein
MRNERPFVYRRGETAIVLTFCIWPQLADSAAPLVSFLFTGRCEAVRVEGPRF